LTDTNDLGLLQEALRKPARLISRSGGRSAANTVFALAVAHQSMTGVGREAYPTREDFEAGIQNLAV
jgi:hypothetical protein